MDDAEHLRQFEDQSLPHERWNHRAHLKVAYLYLVRFPFEEAVCRMRVGVRAYNAAHGIVDSLAGGYHETITCAWLQLVQTMIRQFGPSDSADAFFETQTQLNSPRGLLLFYSHDLLMSAAARATFVAPDLTPLPQPLSRERNRE